VAYEDPIEAALRALTGVEWRKRKNVFETRTNKTHCVGVGLTLDDHRILHASDVSEAQSGRYITAVPITEIAKIEKAVQMTGAEVKPHRRKWHS
jgi:hypothetical protein